ncbi:MAG TPA: Hsp20/alpha crystallin family protein [Candidatus Dormibacteraeota bacterium]|nr:Hsp20/alpha crystallin family protein [Candidatus Dormibacteraeota bacterium]
MDFVIRGRCGRFEPNADAFLDEEREALILTLEVAGVAPESVRLSIEGERLLIVGRRYDILHQRRGSFVLKEIAFGEFGREIVLPVAIDLDHSSATYLDGLLSIVLPIAATAYIPTARTDVRIIVQRTTS